MSRMRLFSVIGAMVVGLSVAAVAQSTRSGPNLALSLDGSGYVNVTATGSGAATPATTGLWSNLFFKTDASGYLKVNCQSGCGGGVGGSTNDVQCNISSALAACETGVNTYNPSTHVLASTTFQGANFRDGSTFWLKDVSGELRMLNNAGTGMKDFEAGTYYSMNTPGSTRSATMSSNGGVYFATNDGTNAFFSVMAASNRGAYQAVTLSSVGGYSWSSSSTASNSNADVSLVRGAAGVVKVTTTDGSTRGKFDAATYQAGGVDGLTGTACTAFTGGICTAGSFDPELRADRLLKRIEEQDQQIAELRALIATLARR